VGGSRGGVAKQLWPPVFPRILRNLLFDARGRVHATLLATLMSMLVAVDTTTELQAHAEEGADRGDSDDHGQRESSPTPETHASATSCGWGWEMLSLAKAAKDYYLQKLGEVSPREDYYLRGGNAVGRWVGGGAADLDLQGTVSAEGLVRLFDGEDPETGKQLGRRLRKDGVAAWDVTFSADKSVSLLWALGDEQTRKEVGEAFDQATSQALGYLESVASATRGASKTVVTDEQGNRKCRVRTWSIPTSGYVAAAFTEYTSRADDPQLHTHVVVANKVKGSDGMWRSLDGRLLYRHQLAAGYLHEAVLRKELTERLGVRWRPVHNGMADIEGFTRHQIEVFSRRRIKLEAWRKEQGLADTPAARQVAVVATREAKHDHPLEELEIEWRHRAAEVGLSTERLARILDRSRQITPPDSRPLFAQLASPVGVTAKAATFGRSEALKEIAGALPQGGDRDQIETLAEQFLEHGQVLNLTQSQEKQDIARPSPTEERPMGRMFRRDGPSFPDVDDDRYTIAELLATEQRIIARAQDRTPVTWNVPRRLVEATLRRRPHLTEEQQEMVQRLATSGAGIDVGVGPAGSGKTTVMAVLRLLTVVTRTPILGAALAARTAVGFQEATGIKSSSLTALNYRAATEGGLPHGVVVVVDEASMVGTRQLAALSDHVDQAGGKLVLIGDDHQLPEIEAGGLFHALVQRLPAVELNQNIRQERSWERAALTELRDGSVADAISSYRQHRRLTIGRSREETLSRAVEDWYQQITSTRDITGAVLLAQDNQTVTKLNELARSQLARSGQLTGPTLHANGREYQRGDRVICLANDRRLGVLNGDLAIVVGVEPEALIVRLDRDPKTRDLGSSYLDEGHVNHGYALTVHKAQGITVDRTFTVVGPDASREWGYVALSRGKKTNRLYLTRPDRPEQCDHVAHTDRALQPNDGLGILSRSSVHTAAVDHQTPEQSTNESEIGMLHSPRTNKEVKWLLRVIAQRRLQERQLEQRRRGRGPAIGL
jgi:conjugative relaxase-like TrwC/TraI family protein